MEACLRGQIEDHALAVRTLDRPVPIVRVVEDMGVEAMAQPFIVIVNGEAVMRACWTMTVVDGNDAVFTILLLNGNNTLRCRRLSPWRRSRPTSFRASGHSSRPVSPLAAIS